MDLNTIRYALQNWKLTISKWTKLQLHFLAAGHVGLIAESKREKLAESFTSFVIEESSDTLQSRATSIQFHQTTKWHDNGRRTADNCSPCDKRRTNGPCFGRSTIRKNESQRWNSNVHIGFANEDAATSTAPKFLIDWTNGGSIESIDSRTIVWLRFA